MKKRLLSLLGLLHIVLLAHAQQVTPQPFTAYFDVQDSQLNRPKTTVGRQVIADSTGIYCFGNTVGTDRIDSNTYKYNISIGATKYAYDGSILWKKWFRSPGYFNLVSGWNCVIDDNTNFVVVGANVDTSLQDSTQIFQPFLFWINKSGDSLRLINHIDSIRDRNITCATQLPDRSILATGQWGSAKRSYNPSSKLYTSDSQSLYIVKYDCVGNILWEKNLFQASARSINNPVVSHKIVQAADGGILICGKVGSALGVGYGHFFAKFDSLGNFLWWKRYPYSSPYIAGTDYVDLIPMSDGGYYFTYMANTRPFSTNPNDYNSLYAYGRANAQGDTLWLKTFSDTFSIGPGGYYQSQPVTMFMDTQHNLYISGNAYDTTDLPTLLITDSNGRIKSKRTYKPYSTNVSSGFMAHTVRSPYNTLVSFGSMQFFDTVSGVVDTLGTYGWLMQTDSFGCVQPGCEVADSIWHYNPTAVVSMKDYEQVVLYPNPASHSVTLKGVPPGSRYDMVDMKGTSAGGGIIQEQHTVIHVEALVPGVYIIRIQVKDKPLLQLRLVKE